MVSSPPLLCLMDRARSFSWSGHVVMEKLWTLLLAKTLTLLSFIKAFWISGYKGEETRKWSPLRLLEHSPHVSNSVNNTLPWPLTSIILPPPPPVWPSQDSHHSHVTQEALCHKCLLVYQITFTSQNQCYQVGLQTVCADSYWQH